MTFKKSMLSLAILMTFPGLASAQPLSLSAHRPSRSSDLSHQSSVTNQKNQTQRLTTVDQDVSEKKLLRDLTSTHIEETQDQDQENTLDQEIALLEALILQEQQAQQQSNDDEWSEWDNWDEAFFAPIPKNHRARGHSSEYLHQKVVKMDRRQSKRLARQERWA